MTVQGEVIAIAIRKSVQYVREHAGMGVWDTARLPTSEETAERKAKVEAICDEMDALADRAVREDVRFPEYEELRSKLADLSAYPLHDDISAVSMAFFVGGRLEARRDGS
jgi:hypothetical protein